MTNTNSAKSPLQQYSAARVRGIVVSIFANILRYVFLVAFSYILMYPLIYVVTHSFRAGIDVTDPTVVWIP